MKKILTGVAVAVGSFLVLVGSIFAVLNFLDSPTEDVQLEAAARSDELADRLLKRKMEEMDSLAARMDSLRKQLLIRRLETDSLREQVSFRDGLIDGYKKTIEKLNTTLQQNEERESRVKDLAKTFESMKVDEIRPILAGVDDHTVITIYRHMNSRTRKNILIALPKKRASSITQQLACGENRVSRRPDAAPQSGSVPTGKIDREGHSPEQPVSGGYRVQLFWGTELEYARQVKTAAEERLDVPVYLGSKGSHYYVRAGDFTDRRRALEYCRLARKQGFADAWVVKSDLPPPRAALDAGGRLQ